MISRGRINVVYPVGQRPAVLVPLDDKQYCWVTPTLISNRLVELASAKRMEHGHPLATAYRTVDDALQAAWEFQIHERSSWEGVVNSLLLKREIAIDLDRHVLNPVPHLSTNGGGLYILAELQKRWSWCGFLGTAGKLVVYRAWEHLPNIFQSDEQALSWSKDKGVLSKIVQGQVM